MRKRTITQELTNVSEQNHEKRAEEMLEKNIFKAQMQDYIDE